MITFKLKRKMIKRFSNRHQREDSSIPSDWSRYKAMVERLTNDVAFLIPGIEKREFYKWDIDHKIPIAYGFKNRIHPLKMACLSNLRVIPHTENFQKNDKLLFPLSILDQHDHIYPQLQEG